MLQKISLPLICPKEINTYSQREMTKIKSKQDQLAQQYSSQNTKTPQEKKVRKY